MGPKKYKIRRNARPPCFAEPVRKKSRAARFRAQKCRAGTGYHWQTSAEQKALAPASELTSLQAQATKGSLSSAFWNNLSKPDPGCPGNPDNRPSVISLSCWFALVGENSLQRMLPLIADQVKLCTAGPLRQAASASGTPKFS